MTLRHDFWKECRGSSEAANNFFKHHFSLKVFCLSAQLIFQVVMQYKFVSVISVWVHAHDYKNVFVST